MNSCTLRVRLPATAIEIEIGGRLILDGVVVVVGSKKVACSSPYFNYSFYTNQTGFKVLIISVLHWVFSSFRVVSSEHDK